MNAFVTLALELPDGSNDRDVALDGVEAATAGVVIGVTGLDPRVTVPVNHPVVEVLLDQRDEARALADEFGLLLQRADDALELAQNAILAVQDSKEVLQGALDSAEAERIALADNFRAVLESQGMTKTLAALVVQGVIDSAHE